MRGACLGDWMGCRSYKGKNENDQIMVAVTHFSIIPLPHKLFLKPGTA